MSFEKYVSNLIENMFPDHYKENGPILVEFVKKYYEWLESKTPSRNNWINPNRSYVDITINSANVIGFEAYFTENYANGDQIAIATDRTTGDFEVYTINQISNNTFLTLTTDKLPLSSVKKTLHATVTQKGNPVYLTRRFMEIQDIDETFEEYLIYFKEKYLKGLQFDTLTNTRKLIKHSLDLYRSKGTERSIDLLYKIVFGKPANVYYPGQDIFRLSSAKWVIPRYLELSYSPENINLINRQVTGVLSGATCFVEEIVKILINNKVIDVAYVSSIKGNFISGEKITAQNVDVDLAPVIVGSLNEVEMDIIGSGDGFELNEIVEITSTTGVGAKGKVISIANSSGTLIIELQDGGYAYSNTEQHAFLTGTVNVDSSNTEIEGIGTVFEEELTVGDFISIYSNSTFYETRTVDEIESNTALTVNSAFSFTNGTANAAYTRYSAQTFISEKILTLSNCTIDNTYTWYDYFRFGEQIRQPIVNLNYEQANNTFVEGDLIYTYYANNDPKGSGEVLFVSKRTANSGLIVASQLSGNLNATNIFTEANAVTAVLSVANGYVEITATANVIGAYSNVALTCNNLIGEFEEGEEVFQPTSGAEGFISSILEVSNTEVILFISNNYGVFKTNTFIWGLDSGAQGDLKEFSLNIGVVNVSNQFFTYTDNYTVSTNGHISGTITSVSLGSGADVQISNTLLYTESIDINTDKVQPYLDYRLAIPISVTVDTSANDTTLLFLSSGNTDELAIGFRLANSDDLSVVNTDAGATIANVVNSTAIETDIDIIIANGTANLNARVQWPFPANSATDLESIVADSWTYETLTIGKIEFIQGFSQGFDYNREPIIRFWEPNTWVANKYDTYEFDISNINAPFEIGEVVTQSYTNARGLVLEGSNTSHLIIQSLRFYANNKFVTTSNTSTMIAGTDSGATANIDLIEERIFSQRLGLDNEMDISVSSTEGSITGIQVIDSGFGFINAENVTITSNGKSAEGVGLLITHGEGTGYYQTRDGFLSDSKKLSDGWYYQEYSYDVRSGVINEFKNNLKNILHVAGTKYFSSLFYDTINSGNNTVETESEEISGLYTGFFPIGDWEAVKYYYIYEDNENIFPIINYQLLDVGPFDMNEDPTLSTYINTTIDLNDELYQIVNIMYDMDVESETIDLEDTLRRI